MLNWINSSGSWIISKVRNVVVNTYEFVIRGRIQRLLPSINPDVSLELERFSRRLKRLDTMFKREQKKRMEELVESVTLENRIIIDPIEEELKDHILIKTVDGDCFDERCLEDIDKILKEKNVSDEVKNVALAHAIRQGKFGIADKLIRVWGVNLIHYATVGDCAIIKHIYKQAATNPFGPTKGSRVTPLHVPMSALEKLLSYYIDKLILTVRETKLQQNELERIDSLLRDKISKLDVKEGIRLIINAIKRVDLENSIIAATICIRRTCNSVQQPVEERIVDAAFTKIAEPELSELLKIARSNSGPRIDLGP